MSKKQNEPPAPVVPLFGLPMFGDPVVVSSGMPTLQRVTTPSKNYYEAFVGGTFGEPTLTFVGGLGRNHIVITTDGETFTSVATTGRGLRSIVRDGDTTWLSGEYGTLFKATSDLSSLEAVPLNTQACLHGLARTSDGSIWVAGDNGFLARSRSGGPFERVAGVDGTIRKMVPTPAGLLLPSKNGLFIVHDSTPEKLGPGDVNHVVITRAKTHVVVGNKNTILRSTNGGRSFEAAEVPEFVATEMPPAETFARPSWLGDSNDLNTIAELPDGRLVVAGDHGVVLVSMDDGQTFQRIEHCLIGGSLWASGTWNGSVFLAGENNIVLRVA